MKTPSVLVVEDAKDLRELVVFHLTKEGYLAREAGSGEAAIAECDRQPPDLVLLDLMLPGIDGLSVCRKLKSQHATAAIPIVMLTAKGEEADIITGLETGADDYVTKPFSPRILMARVRSALRRAQTAVTRNGREPEDDEYVSGEIVIRPARHEVLVDGEKRDLTASEFKLLWRLARRPGLVFTRNQLLDALHGEMHAVTDRAIDVQVVGLRRKLGSAGARIETVRGVGYRFTEVADATVPGAL